MSKITAVVTINNIEVSINQTDEGVVVDMCATNDESKEPLASTWLSFAECRSSWRRCLQLDKHLTSSK